jgi:hypothetical protein
MRTIVFSDVHGEPAVINRVLEHSGYDPAVDQLLFAGDAIDIGRDSWGCLELLDELGAQCLVGNHEFSVWLGEPLELVEPDLHVQVAVTQRIDAGEWPLAACVEGVLVTHAGLSEEYAVRFTTGERGSAEQLAAALNAEFAEAVSLGSAGVDEAIDWESPLWYRPSARTPSARGVLQVAGHTPIEVLRGDGAAETWASHGLHLVDPFVRRWVRVSESGWPAPLRYAAIEGGVVTVVEGEGHLSGY